MREAIVYVGVAALPSVAWILIAMRPAAIVPRGLNGSGVGPWFSFGLIHLKNRRP